MTRLAATKLVSRAGLGIASCLERVCQDLFDQKVKGTAWKSKPRWYIVAKNDKTVHPELERFVAKRMRATVTEQDSNHVPSVRGATAAAA